MSFLLLLEVDGLTEEQGRAVEEESRTRGTWPIHLQPRSRRWLAIFGPRYEEPSLWMPDQLDRERHLLTDEAIWDAPAWAMEPELLPAFADAIRLLGELLPQGFALRATWGGSEIREERVLTADELAELALASQLNEFTRYRVPAVTGSSA